MNEAPTKDLISHFSKLKDPRIERKKLHKLIDIFVIAICAVICGADDWVAIEMFGKTKYKWFKEFLELKNGIPSHDTFGRIFARIKPNEFKRCFLKWIQAIAKISNGEIIPIDGKTLRRSYSSEDNKAAIHMVSAWACKNKMVLGQVKTSEKSNEITAIPKLLNMLEIAGCIVTIDAMGCQKNIASKILEKSADYVLALKGNQGTLLEDVKLYLDDLKKNNLKDVKYDYHEEIEKNRERIEKRRYWITTEVEWLNERHKWEGLKSIGVVESRRQIKDTISTEYRYYICSIEAIAKIFANAVRSHWAIENSLHWTLDIAFREDESRIRKDHSPENFALLRHIALNLLKNEKSCKVGVKNKRLKAGWDNRYLEKLLFSTFCHS
jgi:predicted transposase YbfD/YdcC